MKCIFITACLLFTNPCISQYNWQKVHEELILHKPPFSACHASTLVELSPGKLLVAFFDGAHEGNNDVSIWSTSLSKQQWKKPVLLAQGFDADSTRFPCWNPVLFKNRLGKLFLFYKVGPNPREWWGMLQTSDNNGKKWGAAKMLAPGFIGPVKNKPVQLIDGSVLAPSSIETRNDRWQVHIERSVDEGKTWEFIPVDTGSTFKVIQPSILVYPGNRLQILCRSNQDRIVEAWSDNGGRTWSKLSKLDLPNPNSGTDAVTLKNGWQLLVYNPAVSGKEWFNSRGRLNVALSKDGREWTDIAILENGGEKDEFSYPAVIQTSDGSVHITYTYNRKNIKHVILKQTPGIDH